MDALLGVMILLLTFSFARNLPGLLEVTLSASNRISSSARYTLATLARYAITIAGTVSAFTLLGLRWGQLQWMVAALTVGLGFGLQEIFANFVSGLILLVERPFRVGDVITIDTLTGTVTRIRTRATTVLDFDNKEIVIPNKTFITGQVTNWTLSDDVTRLVIDVPVAHGNDPEQVRDMLLDIARSTPGAARARAQLLVHGAGRQRPALRAARLRGQGRRPPARAPRPQPPRQRPAQGRWHCRGLPAAGPACAQHAGKSCGAAGAADTAPAGCMRH